MTTDFDSSYTQYQLNRGRVRKLVRQAYLKRAASLVRGPSLDFGCGVGELLQLLPVGSRGVEYNTATVEYCLSRGLPVDPYDGFKDNWSLSMFPTENMFQSMVISHVLEHLESPIDVLKKLLTAVPRLGVRRVLVIVPGKEGFRVDPTHLKFVDEEMLRDPMISASTGFTATHAAYFPGNLRSIGDWFAYHELQMVFEWKGNPPPIFSNRKKWS